MRYSSYRRRARLTTIDVARVPLTIIAPPAPGTTATVSTDKMGTGGVANGPQCPLSICERRGPYG